MIVLIVFRIKLSLCQFIKRAIILNFELTLVAREFPEKTIG